MKPFMLSILFAFSHAVVAQDATTIPTDAAGRAHYQTIATFDSLPKADIYAKALRWVAVNYKSAKTVTQTADPDAGLIVLKAATAMQSRRHTGFVHTIGYFDYTFTIEVKDAKLRVTVEELTYQHGQYGVRSGADLADTYPANWLQKLGRKDLEKDWSQLREAAHGEITLLMTSLVLAVGKKEDW